MKRPPKYRNVKTTVDGVLFDSIKESRRYSELMLLQRAGAISELELQPRFDLMVNGKKVGRFTPDFRYEHAGSVVVEDVKSPASKTTAYRLRKRVFEAQYGIQVVET
jgi:hypothetical protein